MAPLPFDPIDEAARQWAEHWEGVAPMHAVTSLMRVQQLVLARLDGVLKPFGLTFARYEALVLLTFSSRGSLPLGKMGERLQVHPTSVTSIVDRLEADCDSFGDPLPSLRSFVLPGGAAASAHLHVARTIVRRAERTAWSAVERYGTEAPGGLNVLAITYLNRLSDLLFILSRAANAADPSIASDVLWVPGGSRHRPDSPPPGEV